MVDYISNIKKKKGNHQPRRRAARYGVLIRYCSRLSYPLFRRRASGYATLRTNKLLVLFALVVFGCANFLCAETYTFGGKKGWNEVNVRNGITTGSGRFGYEYLELDTNANEYSSHSDLFLDFEKQELIDSTGKYTVTENSTFFSKKAVRGKGAALSRRRGNGIVLSGDETSLFGCEGPAGSFVIDFWLCPATVENGEVILNWRSSRNIFGEIVYQLLSMSFYQNRAMILFSNIFEGYTENNGDVTLVSDRSIIPGKWARHTIYFREDTGTLEYRIDGALESICFMTTNKHENGTVFPAVMGVSAELELCPQYTGLVDDFKIDRTYTDFTFSADSADDEHLFSGKSKFNLNGGRFESTPFLLAAGTSIKSVKSELLKPEQTEIKLYIRGGETYFNWTDSYPQWHLINQDGTLEELSGMYFQVAGELFPDGSGTKTPSVTQIDVEYEKLPEVQPPYKITATPGNEKVTLSWSHSVDETAGGYYIYYGTRPGEYLGRVAQEGPSPVNVGNVTNFTLSGLKNGTIYYFAICAYSKIDSRVCGVLSKEVYARPQADVKK